MATITTMTTATQVALPINKPAVDEDVTDYRIQLAFDGAPASAVRPPPCDTNDHHLWITVTRRVAAPQASA